MDPVAIARWQFGITTVYHFLFVPITIAMSMLVAVLQTIWVRTGKERYLRLTKFFGKLFLINFALGVVTGIVQEFQFGMNWSEYSRFVGNVFGAPLAFEALLAFFMESTFLGLWIFGWDKLPKKIHLACAMVHSPSILVLDEPFEAVDPISAQTIQAILRDYAAAGGTVVISSHVMATVQRLCTYVAIIARGRVLTAGTTAQVAAGADLEDRFTQLVGGPDAREELSWLRPSSS